MQSEPYTHGDRTGSVVHGSLSTHGWVSALLVAVWQAKFGAHAMVGHRWAWRVAHWHNGAHVAPPGQNVPPTTPPRCHNAEFSHLMLRSSRWSSPLLRSIFWPILCAPEHFFAYFKCSGALFCPFCALRSIAQRIKPNFACHTARTCHCVPSCFIFHIRYHP